MQLTTTRLLSEIICVAYLRTKMTLNAYKTIKYQRRMYNVSSMFLRFDGKYTVNHNRKCVKQMKRNVTSG